VCGNIIITVLFTIMIFKLYVSGHFVEICYYCTIVNYQALTSSNKLKNKLFESESNQLLLDDGMEVK
jgi:hypothetical protein